MIIDRKETLTIFKKHQLDKYHEMGYNLVACGASRGGTSALGILMRYFDFPMGDNLHPSTHEDIDFAKIVGEGRYQDLPNLIKEKAKKTDCWSVKMPHALKHLKVFDDSLNRCMFFIVIRNPFSVSNSLIKYDDMYKENLDDYLRGMDHALDFYSKLHDLKYLTSPFVICEYEKILLNPRQFVLDFLYSTGVQASDKEIDEAIELISSSGYKEVKSK